MNESSVILNIAYFVLVAAAFTRAVLSLRIALVIGAIGFIVYGLVASIATVVLWNTVTGTLHSIQLYRYISARRAVHLTDDDERWRRQLFPDLDRFDFYSLWSMGEESRFSDQRLLAVGEDHKRIAIVLEGRVEVTSATSVIAELGEGALYGEMSYVRGLPANSDVHAVGDVRVRMWDQDRVRVLDQLNPPAGRAFGEFVQRDLATKLS